MVAQHAVHFNDRPGEGGFHVLARRGFITSLRADAVDNDAAGLISDEGEVIAKGCTATGNAVEATCSPSGVGACVDIWELDKAVLVDTVCNAPAEICST